MGRRCGDLFRHALIFPGESLRFLPYMLFNGVRGAVRGGVEAGCDYRPCIGPYVCDWTVFELMGEGGGLIVGLEDVMRIASWGPRWGGEDGGCVHRQYVFCRPSAGCPWICR